MSKTEFEKAGERKQLSFFGEVRLFVVENKKWWLLPIIVALALVGVLLALAATGAAPFIYSVF